MRISMNSGAFRSDLGRQDSDRSDVQSVGIIKPAATRQFFKLDANVSVRPSRSNVGHPGLCRMNQSGTQY